MQGRKKFYSHFERPADLCFDIGANTGEKSRVLLELGARVAAVEPQSQCGPALEELKRKYGEHFIYIRKAVGDVRGDQELYIGNTSEISTFSGAHIKYFGRDGVLRWNKKETVEVITLDELLTEYGTPSFLKVDTEGYETNVLSRLSRKINHVEFEFIPAFKAEAKKCIDMIARFGRVEFNYNIYEQPRFELQQWVDADEMKLVLDNIPPNIVHGNVFARCV
ncbi:MAG TPA: FkbM family methyltransferase [Bacteroidia bacterium]